MCELIVPPDRASGTAAASRATYSPGLPSCSTGASSSPRCARRPISSFELTITRILLPGPPMFIAYVRDITERHTAEADLHASRASIVAGRRPRPTEARA